MLFMPQINTLVLLNLTTIGSHPDFASLYLDFRSKIKFLPEKTFLLDFFAIIDKISHQLKDFLWIMRPAKRKY